MNAESDNLKEVGFHKDDDNTTRLPETVNPEPTMGAGPFNFASSRSDLDVADTLVVGKVGYDGGYGMEGSMAPSLNPNVDVTNSDTTLMAPVGDSETNLSRKYKYPNVTQSIPPGGKPGVQFEDHK